MSATLTANIYGVEMPVIAVIEYGEHEISFGEGDFERVRYANVMLEMGNYVVHGVDLRDLTVHAPSVREDCAICENMQPLQCDKHAGRI